jgi:hypothetical protein
MEEHSSHRILTDNEARVAWSILSGGLTSEEDRMRDSGIPRSTYRYAKHRLYSEGLLEDRFVPSPDAIGVPRVSFVLSRPAAEEAGSVADTLSKTPGIVEAWSGTQTSFAVVFHRSIEAGEAFQRKAAEGKLGNPLAIVTVDAEGQRGAVAQVPVYFDFEGAWARYCSFAATKRYPCPLPPPNNGGSDHVNSQREVPSSVASLLTRHFSRPSHLIGPGSIPRSQRRSLQQGKVEWRVFLGMTRLPTLKYRGLRFQDLVFVTGRPREDDGMANLLPDLLANCNIRPFLLAGDSNYVLMATFGIGLGSVKEAPADVRPRQSVINTMASHLKQIEITREPLVSLRMDVAHRYDLLL